MHQDNLFSNLVSQSAKAQWWSTTSNASHSALNAFCISCGACGVGTWWSGKIIELSAALSEPSTKPYILLRPNMFRKYQDAELTLKPVRLLNKNLPRCIQRSKRLTAPLKHGLKSISEWKWNFRGQEAWKSPVDPAANNNHWNHIERIAS